MTLILKLKNNIKISLQFTLMCILLSVILTPAVYSESAFRAFQTQQPAQNLIPLIAPLYSQQAKITAQNNTLIIKADSSVLNEIEQLLGDIDKPLRNLLIEVATSIDGSEQYQQGSVEGQIRTSDGQLISSHASHSSNNPNISIRYGKNGSIIKTTYTRRNSSKTNPETFKVRTLEGSWASIKTGKKVPYYSSYGHYNKHRSLRENSMELIDVSSGFEVLPTLNGQYVTLKIRPENQSINKHYPDQINTSSVNTTIRGQLNQWLFLGSAIKQINEQNSATLYSTKRQSELNTNYKIRVRLLD